MFERLFENMFLLFQISDDSFSKMVLCWLIQHKVVSFDDNMADNTDYLEEGLTFHFAELIDIFEHMSE